MSDNDKTGKPDASISKAVALAYEHGQDVAPHILAQGQGKLAERMVDLAFDHDVKVRKDPGLVDVLSAFDVGSVIPTEAFKAVAEILAYIYAAERTEAARHSDTDQSLAQDLGAPSSSDQS